MSHDTDTDLDPLQYDSQADAAIATEALDRVGAEYDVEISIHVTGEDSPMSYQSSEEAHAALEALEMAGASFDTEFSIHISEDVSGRMPGRTSDQSESDAESTPSQQSSFNIKEGTRRHEMVTLLARHDYEALTIKDVAAAGDFDRNNASTKLSHMANDDIVERVDVDRDGCRVAYKLVEPLRREFAQYDALNQTDESAAGTGINPTVAD